MNAQYLMTDPNLSQVAASFAGKTFGGDVVVEHGFLYDRVNIAAGNSLDETTSQFFTNVGAGSAKTLAQTNLTQSRKLDPPQMFAVHSIQLFFRGDILRADIDSIFDRFAFQFFVADAYKFRAPLFCFPQGGGVTGAIAGAGGATPNTVTSYISNGVPTIQAIRTLSLPVLIESGISFYANFTGTGYTATAGGSGGTGITMYCVLQGLHARPAVA